MKRLSRNSAAFAIGVIAFCEILQPGSANGSPAVHKIAIEKMAFGPPPPGVHAGDTIEWINNDIFRHSVTAVDKTFDIDIEPNATARIVVRQPGRIQYICKYHPGMTGQLIVGE